MKKILHTAVILLFVNGLYSQVDSIVIQRIDEICKAVEDEFQECVRTHSSTDKIPAKFRGKVHDYHIEYVCNAYYTYDKPVISFHHTTVKGKNIIRIGEGALEIKQAEDFRTKEEYLYPEITENVYYFLDSKLIKINEIKSMTDYNALPANYWLVFPAVSYYFKDNSLIHTSGYFIPDPDKHFGRIEVQANWLESIRLLIKAYSMLAK